jgi:hypothetical protein
MSTAPDEPSPEVLAALKRLWMDPRKVHLVMRGSDAWTTCAIIQFACRNPELSPTQRAVAERVGRELQAAVATLAPDLQGTLELGWDPAHDVPRKDDHNAER